MTPHVLPGLRPAPLGAYLAGLGLLRVLGEQADPEVTAQWTAQGLMLATTVPDLAGWLVEQYVPTPVLSPWNEGSGFGAKDKTPKQALEALAAHPSPRLASFRAALVTATVVGEQSRSQGWTKERTIRQLRNRAPDALLPWIDATVILVGNQSYFPPLLGTGGNDGRLEFSTTFHQRLLEVLPVKAAQATRSLAHARDVLAGEQSTPLSRATGGQFDPLSTGGPNSSPFGVADAVVNPWAFVLMVEGALFFASTAVRRYQHQAGRAAIPFTVASTADGTTSGAMGEESRGEIWAPLWERPFSLPEVTQLFADARAAWRGRPARRAVEFYAATKSLGVARGVAAFARYGLHQRNGLSYVAVPLDRVTVQARPEVRLVARLEDWVSFVRREAHTGAVQEKLRRFDTAHLAYVRDGGTVPLAGLLAAVTDLEQAVGRSGRTRDKTPPRTPPSAGEFLDVLARASCPELRVAVGIASSATLGGKGEARSMRHLLLPIDPDPRWRDAPLVAGFGQRPLRHVLADVLSWRCRTAPDEQDTTAFRGSPTFRRGIRVPDLDLHAFAIEGRLDEKALDLWLRACLALRWDGVEHQWTDPDEPVTPIPTLGLLHPLANGLAPGRTTDRDVPRWALGPDWPARLAAGHTVAVHADAARRLRQAGWLAVPAPAQIPVDGHTLAAALVPRCRHPQRQLNRHFGIPARSDEPTGTTHAPELIKEMS
ncbi:type I-G CRISPR-associated protein Cas8g1/Csx17 [Micromonospora carbonacea]|uniref:CRISPR-associated protein Csx17 n=1 Tax=Micromonospora carbonacea TaxID=47853 RepID=A0A1C4YDL1_9ACTN|nr:type I-U CRISPR-associated protein Csx17 [Micromonospora carbonacea]SCF18760.1 CRISPR-associated protein Csx17 [Micromonospora carbonacea]